MTRTRLWLSDRRALRELLMREAAGLPTHRSWRTLADGILVAAILEPGEQAVIRVAVEAREDGWEAELMLIATQLGCGDWPHEVEIDEEGDAGAIRYQQPEQPEWVPCRRGCGSLAPKRKGAFVRICSSCAERSRVGMGWAPIEIISAVIT